MDNPTTKLKTANRCPRKDIPISLPTTPPFLIKEYPIGAASFSHVWTGSSGVIRWGNNHNHLSEELMPHPQAGAASRLARTGAFALLLSAFAAVACPPAGA